MRGTHLRGLIVVGGVLITCLGATETAQACNEPYITASPSSAGPGDTITWTIANVEPRAAYTVRVAGRLAADDVAGASAPTGTYQIPDLGSSPREISVEMTVTHAEPSPSHPDGPSNPERDSVPVAYQPTVVPEPAPETPASPPPATSQPDANGRVGSGGRPAEDKGRAEPRDPGPRTGSRVRGPGSDAESPAKTISSLGDEQTPKLLAAAVPVEARAADPRTAHRKEVRARSDTLVPPGPQSSLRLPPVVARDRAIPTVDDRAAPLGIVVAAGSALLFFTLAGFAMWAMRRPSAPDGSGPADGPQWIPPGFGLEVQSLLVEAELQELISEERAREMVRRTAAVRSGPD